MMPKLIALARRRISPGMPLTGTPRPIVERLNAALRHALADAKVRKTFADGGMDVFPAEEQTPEAASGLLKREIKLWGDVIRANHIAGQ